MTRFAAILLALLASVAHGQNIYVRTNQSVSLGSVQESLSITAGREFRVTVNVVQSDGTTPLDLTGVTPRWIIYSAVDGYIGVNTTGTVADVAGGVVRYSAPALGIGEYFAKASLSSVDIEAGAPAIFWASVTVTQALTASAACPPVTVTNVTQFITVTNTTVYTSGVESVEGATGAIDLTSTNGNITFVGGATTIDVGITPSVMTGQVNGITAGGLSNFQGRFDLAAGSGITLTPNATGVTIAATSGSGSETRSFYWSVGWSVNNYSGFASATWYPIQPTNTPACVYYEVDSNNLFNVTNFTFVCATTGQHNAFAWLEEATAAGKNWVLGLYENDILVTNGIGNLYNPSSAVDFLKGVHGYCGDEAGLTGTSFNDAPATAIFYCGNITNVYKLAFAQIAGSAPSLWRGRIGCYWVGTM